MRVPRVRGATIGLILCVGLSSAIAFFATCTAGTVAGTALGFFRRAPRPDDPPDILGAVLDAAFLNARWIGMPLGTIAAIFAAVRVKRAILLDPKPPRIQSDPPEPE